MGWGAAGFALAAAARLDNDTVGRHPELKYDSETDRLVDSLLDFASRLRRT